MKRIIVQSAMVVALFVFVGPSPLADLNHVQARVYFENKVEYVDLARRGLDVVSGGNDFFEIVTDPNELVGLQEAGYETTTIHDDLSAFYRGRLFARPTTAGGYKSLEEIYAALDTIIADHPDIVSSKTNLGKTIEDRDMWAVKISDNPEIDEDEPELLFTAAIHSREVITPEVLLGFMNYLTDNYAVDPEVTNIVDNREIWLVLMVNPDGYHRNDSTDPDGGGMWRKNRRDNGDGTFGVDLNRNFGYKWGYDDVGSSPDPSRYNYRGVSAFSEPEAGNMRDFVESHEFVIVTWYHSAANEVLWSWGYDRFYTPDEDIFVALGDSIYNLNSYAPGASWKFYLANGNAGDWTYGEQTTKNKCFTLTVEVGSYDDGFWPPLNRIPELVEENLEPNLFLSRMAGSIYSLRSPVAPTMVLPTSVDSFGYNVAWTFSDSLNPAVAFELVEMQGYQSIVDSTSGLSHWDWDNEGFAISTERSHSGSTSFYSGEGEELPRHLHVQTVESHLVMPGDTLSFWAWYDIEPDWDYAYVEISTDRENFAPAAGTITTNYDPNGNNRGEGITGSSGGWVQGLFDLSSFVGEQIFVRFTYDTDERYTNEGIYVDDIYPVSDFVTRTMLSNSLADTTYHLTDKPTGVYYYIARAKDAQQQWGYYSKWTQAVVEAGSDCCINLTGNVDNDPAEMVDLGDLTALIDYLFITFKVPVCMQEANIDGDPAGIVDIGDLTALIDYLFITFTPPAECLQVSNN